MFQDGASQHFVTETPPPFLCLLFLTTDAKNLEDCTFKVDETACIRGKLSNWQTSFNFQVMYFFLNLQSAFSLVWLLSYTFLCGVSLVILSKPSSLVTECHALHFGLELWKLTLPKQYYSIQPSHTFNNDKTVLPCTKIIIDFITRWAQSLTWVHKPYTKCLNYLNTNYISFFQ